MKVNDEILIAYCDGELDADMCSAVERSLADSASMRQRLDSIRTTDRLIRASCSEVLAQPQPLIEYGANGQAEWMDWLLTAPRMAFAGLVCLLLGGIGGFLAKTALIPSDIGQLITEKNERMEMNGQLISVLERQISGVPFRWRAGAESTESSITIERTWKNDAGEFCREYDYQYTEHGEVEREQGVACRREDGVWILKLVIYPNGERIPYATTKAVKS